MRFNIFNIVYISYFYGKTDGFCGKRGAEEERSQGKVGENGMGGKGNGWKRCRQNVKSTLPKTQKRFAANLS